MAVIAPILMHHLAYLIEMIQLLVRWPCALKELSFYVFVRVLGTDGTLLDYCSGDRGSRLRLLVQDGRIRAELSELANTVSVTSEKRVAGERAHFGQIGVQVRSDGGQVDLTLNVHGSLSSERIESAPLAATLTGACFGASLEGQSAVPFDIAEVVLTDRFLEAEQRKVLLAYFQRQWYDLLL